MKNPPNAKAIALALILSCWIAPGTAQAAPDWVPEGEIEWDCTYDAAALPTECEPSWRESVGADTEAKVEESGLRIVDSGTATGSLHCYQRGWRAMSEQGAIVEAQIKLVNNTSRSGAFIMAADGVHECSLTLFPDRISVFLADDTALVHAMNPTDGFHVYRLAARGTDLYAWVDGKLVIDGTGKFLRPAHSGRNQTMFGSCSSKAESDATYAYVRYAALGERPPLPARYAEAEDVIIYKKPGVYACFPSLVQAEDGTLFTSFGTRTRRSHIDNTGGGARRVSKDGGRTWEPFKGAWPVSDFSKCEDGSLVSANAYGWRNVPVERRGEFEEQGITVRDVRPGVVAYLQGARIRRKPNGSEKWETEELSLPAHKSLMNFNSSSHCKLANGVRLSAIYGKLKEDTGSRTFVLRSADDGKTWWFLPLAADPAGKVHLNETAIAENSQGEVVAMLRAEPPNGGYLYQSISKDSGITWSPPARTDLWGYPAHLLRLQDGRMLCTYGYRRDNMGVRAVLSSDGGHTWDSESIILLRNDAAPYGSDLGYPITVETAPGQLFTIYYFTLDDGVTHIAGTHWKAPKAE